MIRKVERERLTVISARPFDEVVAAIKASIGNPNMAEFVKSTQEAKSATDLEVAIQPVLGRTGLMLFVEFDSADDPPQGHRPPRIENHSSRHRESSHHEGDGEACSGRRLVCSGYRPRG